MTLHPIWSAIAIALAPGVVSALQDPTAPPAAWATQGGNPEAGSAPAPPLPELQGIRSVNPASALISGKVLQVGQKIHDHTVLRIERNAVVLRDAQGQRLRVTLVPGRSAPTRGRGIP